MSRQIVDECKRMYEAFLTNRTAPGGTTLSNLKDKIDSLHDQEFILTMEIGSTDNG